MHQAPDYTRAVFDVSADARFEVFTLANPHRVVLDVRDARLAPGFELSSIDLASTPVRKIRGGPQGADYRLVLDVDRSFSPKAFVLPPVAPYRHRLVIDLYETAGTPRRDTARATAPTAPSAPRPDPSPPPSPGARKTLVVIDPGHGGEDPGAIGVGGVYEKHVVLGISRELAHLLNATPGFQAALVRNGDYYVALRDRTQAAREKRADLFVSVHADAFKSPNVRGASVYTLSERGATSETARWLAEKENRSDLIGGVDVVKLGDKDDLLAHVLLDLSMTANRSASIDAAEVVLNALKKVTAVHRRGVEQAGFVVLKSPDVPSMLVESGYLSHPGEARDLAKPAYQQRIARALHDGITRYLSTHPPPGTFLAARKAPGPRQYVIEEGDTLSGIAARHSLTIHRLREVNKLKGDMIRVGQVLTIPSS